MCEAKSEGLVRYPTTLAPVSGSVTVTTQCADNANTTDSKSRVTRMVTGLVWFPTVTALRDAMRSLSVGFRYAKVSSE